MVGWLARTGDSLIRRSKVGEGGMDSPWPGASSLRNPSFGQVHNTVTDCTCMSAVAIQMHHMKGGGADRLKVYLRQTCDRATRA